MRRFLIDTDTASDDAVALVMALKNRTIQVEAITVVAGNVPLDQAVQNALYTVELCGSNIPVYAGASAPLERPLETAQFVHGVDGMGDIGLDLFGRAPAFGHAPEVIVDIIAEYGRELTLVTLGPLTNLALALKLNPKIARQVFDCVVMGGVGGGPGNITQSAEYNMWVDPEAAEIVFSSGMPITLVGWDVSCRFATFDSEDAERLLALETDLARFCVGIQRTLTRYAIEESGLRGFDLPDPITMAIAIEHEIAKESDLLSFHSIGTADDNRGDLQFGTGCEIELVTTADRGRFLEMLRAAVS